MPTTRPPYAPELRQQMVDPVRTVLATERIDHGPGTLAALPQTVSA